MPEANPVNVFGLAFGTTYPHFVYDDHLHGNRRLPYTYIPIAFYEARVRIDEHHEKDIKRLWDILQKAVDNAWTMNMFFHPVYIARTPECTEAIDQLLKFIEQTGYRSVHMGNDKLCLWWFDRSKSEVITEKQTEKELVLKVSATNKEGLVIRIPDSLGFNVCFVDEKKTVCERRKIAGRYCLLAVIPQGVHQVVLKREVPL
jgi:hypothetical protein